MSDNNSTLEDKLGVLHQRIQIIEAYQKLAEWLCNEAPSNKNLIKIIKNGDVLLEVIQELAKYARQRASDIVTGVEDLTRVFSDSDLEILRNMLQKFREKSSN